MPEGPTPGLTYRLGRGEVTLRPDGSVAAVVPQPGAASQLTGGGLVRVRRDGTELAWSAPRAAVAVDEVELDHTTTAGVGLLLRHSFAAGWSVRVALVNQTLEPMTLLAELTWEPAPECAAWALGAGATGAYAIPGPAGRGPLLGGELVLGSCDRVSDRGIGLGRIELGPLARHVVQWRWDWYATPRAFSRRRFSAVPRDLVLAENEAAQIAADDDEAVVAPGLDLARRGGHLEFSSLGGHRVVVEVRGRRGVTAYELEWVRPLVEVLAPLGERLLAGSRSRTGVLRLPDVDAALVLQELLRHGRLDQPDEADDALGLFVSRPAAAGTGDGRGVSLLCGEFERTGEVDLLDRAGAELLTLDRPVRGLGLAAAQLCVARLTAGRSADDVLAHLAGLVASVAGDRDDADAGLDEVATALELRLTSAPRTGPAAFGLPAADSAVLRIGTALGAGLRGRPVRPLPVDRQAYLAVVLGLLPEALGARPRAEWGVRPHEVARTAEAEVLARLGGRPPAAAHSWLIMGARLA